MTPTIVLKHGRPFLITGSPGSSRIITTVLQVVVNTIDLNMPVGEAVSAARFHQQWWPDQVLVEPGVPPEGIAGLEKRGHKVVPTRPATSANSILVTPQGFVGAPDPRSRGSAAPGF
jgi:gamma-glutamyltranspeptidase/glutathione hydrolase